MGSTRSAQPWETWAAVWSAQRHQLNTASHRISSMSRGGSGLHRLSACWRVWHALPKQSLRCASACLPMFVGPGQERTRHPRCTCFAPVKHRLASASGCSQHHGLTLVETSYVVRASKGLMPQLVNATISDKKPTVRELTVLLSSFARQLLRARTDPF